jgi:glycosyl transferase family 25
MGLLRVLPVFVINLDRSVDRLAHIGAELARVHMSFERVAGVDGRLVPPDLRPQFLDGDNPLGRLSDGEIGCYASHLKAHQRILSEGLPYALVLEDDARLTPDLPEVANAAIAFAPEGWDVIHLSATINRAACAIHELRRGHHLIRHMRPPRNSAGYLISRSGAAKMLRSSPRTRTVDLELKLAHKRSLDVLGVYPSPVIWSNHLPSIIGEAYGWKVPLSRWAAVQEFLYAVRKLGLLNYGRCILANMRSSLEWRFAGRRRDGIPIVKPAATPIRRTPPQPQA